MSDRVPVVFVAGAGRSGSTLLGNLLGSIPGAASVGEARHVWRRGLVGNWSCGCGRSFNDCPVWQGTMERAFGMTNSIDVEQLMESERSLFRLRNSPGALRWKRRPPGSHAHLSWATERLYSALLGVTKATVIVDSSKTPSYGAFLATLSGIDLRVVHLVRDPRATAHSWLNPKPSPERGAGGTMDQMGPLKSAFLWSWWNGLANRLWESESTLVRYEDLTSSPQAVLEHVVSAAAPELAPRPLPLSGPLAEVGISHTVSGNPARMRSGRLVVTPDERWVTGLPRRHRVMVEAMTRPLMRRYGYEVGR